MALIVGDLLVLLRADTTGFNASLLGASKTLEATGKKMTKLGATLRNSLSLPLAIVGGAAIKMSNDFETSMSQIVGLVGVARDQVEAWKDDIKALAPEVGRTSTELGKAMFYITSAGLRGDSALKALDASARGAAAGLGETNTVADAATSALNAYGEANLSAEKAVSILVATVREGKAEASSIAPVLGRVIPIAAELGVSFDQVGAAMAAMTRLGLNAEMSATALRSTLSAILKPTKQGEEELKKYGTSMSELRAILKEKGLIALLTELKDTFGDNEESMQKVFRNVRALNGVLSLVGKNVDQNVKIFGSLAKTTEDDLAKAFEEASSTGKYKFNTAMAELQNSFIEFGDILKTAVVPMITSLGKKFQSLSETLNNLSPRRKEMLADLTLMAIAFGPVLWAAGKLLTLVGMLGTAFTTFNGIMLGTIVPTSGFGAALAAVNAALGVVGGATLGLTLGIGALGLAIGLIIGKAIRPWVNEMLGLNEAFGLVADKNQDLTDGLLQSQEGFDNAVSVLNKLKEQLHLSGKEWDFVAEKTRTNAERIQLLTDKALMLAKKRREGVELAKEEMTIHEQAVDIATRAVNQVNAGVEKANKAYETKVQLLKEELGLMTKGDIQKALEEMVVKYEDMKKLGIDNTQLGEAFGDEMLRLLTLAKENKVELPAGTREMSKDLKDKINPAVGKLVESWQSFNTNANATGKVLEGVFWSTGEKARTALSGGFKDGIKEGVEHGKVAWDAWVKRIEETPIYVKITPDINSLEDFNRAVQDAMSGRSPSTGG